jgi:hypothetical protein
MEINEVDVPREELEIVPDLPTEDWNPEGYVIPDYDDPGNFDAPVGAKIEDKNA